MCKKDLLTILSICVACLAIVLAGKWDAEQEKQEIRTYCENVRDGSWPDYNKNYEVLCHE